MVYRTCNATEAKDVKVIYVIILYRSASMKY